MSNHIRREHPRGILPGGFLPAPVLSSLRPLVRNGLASQSDRYAQSGKMVIQILRRLDRFSVEITPARKGFLPPATRGLGCAVQMEFPASTGCPRQGSASDARAAISEFECWPMGEAHKRQESSCSLNDMPKGPGNLPSTTDDGDVSCWQLGIAHLTGRMSRQDIVKP